MSVSNQMTRILITITAMSPHRTRTFLLCYTGDMSNHMSNGPENETIQTNKRWSLNAAVMQTSSASTDAHKHSCMLIRKRK